MEKLYHNREWLYDQYWNKEKSQIDIAKECNVITNTIYRQMKKMNIPKRKKLDSSNLKFKNKKYNNKKWLEEQYIDNKKSIREIAKIINCNHETIRRSLIKFDIKRREEGFQEGHIISRGLNSPCYKGIEAKSRAIHSWILKRKEKSFICEDCNEKKDTILSFNHKLGNYTRDPNDYKWLCYKCHFKRDTTEFNIKIGFQKYE